MGGPLSALFFVLCVDPFLAALCAQLEDGDLLDAYADDIAAVVQNLWHTGPKIALQFSEFACISNLKLTPAKCVLIPLWRCSSLRNVSMLLHKLIPVWFSFEVTLVGKYPGLWLGPGAGDKSWQSPAAKFESRCRHIHSLGLGLLQ